MDIPNLKFLYISSSGLRFVCIEYRCRQRGAAALQRTAAGPRAGGEGRAVSQHDV